MPNVENERSPPRYVATIGLHSSASTWVFNVVRELLCSALGAERVVAIYTDEAHEVPDITTLGERHVVLKSHQGSPGLDAWLDSVHPTIILSVRDPRDAAISMAQRFSAPLKAAAHWLLQDCRRLMRLAAAGHRLLRYEDRFFEDSGVLAQLSAQITPTVPPETQSVLFQRYRSDSVRQFAAVLGSLPPERLIVSERMMYDRVTQIHRGHVGDTRSGKWRELPPGERAEITQLFEPFLQSFGYETNLP
jgi:hypothetical protein